MTLDQAMQSRSDSTTLFLSFMCNAERGLNTAERARRIRKCAKIVSTRTEDKTFKLALKTIRNTKNNELVIEAVSKAVTNYFKAT